MIPLDELIAATEAEIVMRGARSVFGGFAHDSRILAPGDCFVAVRGMRGDGHDFVADAIERGAGAVVIERARRPAIEVSDPGFVARLTNAGASLLVVEDTRAALKRYAAHILARWRPTVIAVTGGVGKTTTKEAIAEVMSVAAPTFRSWRNFNDLLGLPLSLGRLEPAHRYAVLELGADHPGEIAELCALIHPQVGVVTNSADAQLQYFGDAEGYRAELASLPAALPPDGWAVLNADDEATPLFASHTNARVSYFAPISADARRTARVAVRYRVVEDSPHPRPLPQRERGDREGSGVGDGEGERRAGGLAGDAVAGAAGASVGDGTGAAYLTLAPLGDDATPIAFPQLIGAHWAYAVLAALTVGVELEVDAAAALAALQAMRPLAGRLRRLDGVDGLTLLDDSHNATPASAAAGLRALARFALCAMPPLRRIAVLGDMLRLGDQEEAAHRTLGRLATTHADYLVTRGQRAELIAEAAIQAGLPAERVAVTHTAEDAARAAQRFAVPTPSPSPEGRGEAHGSTNLAIPHPVPPTIPPLPPAGEGPGVRAVVYVKGSEEARMEQVTSLLLAAPERAEELLDRQTQGWRRVVVMRPDRPTWLEVDLNAIASNTRLVKALVGPDVRVLISMKADAYGHGALPVARTTLNNGAEWLGVATLSEAQPLRAAGVAAPILVFGYIPPWQARDAVRLDLRATVYDLAPAKALAQAAVEQGTEARVHVKIDTGMARLGLRWEDIPAIVDFFQTLRATPGLSVEGVFTHFATADSSDQTYARRQLERFHTVLATLDAEGLRPPITHAANSAATLTLPEARFDMVRPGIAIYGLAPSDDVRLPEGFRPALAFKTQVAQVKDVPAGEGVSYGATYITTRQTRIAVLPVGYADGFRRGPTNWGEVLLRGQRAPILGRVCMDQCMVDVTHIPGVEQGDEVVLIGRQGSDELTAEAVATRLGAIAYEVVAELLARVPRVS